MLLAASIIHVYKLQSLNKRYISQITAWAPLVGRLPSSAQLLSTAAARGTHLIVILARSLGSSPELPSSPPPSTWLRKVRDLI